MYMSGAAWAGAAAPKAPARAAPPVRAATRALRVRCLMLLFMWCSFEVDRAPGERRLSIGVIGPSRPDGFPRVGSEERADQLDHAAVVVQHGDQLPLVEHRARVRDAELDPRTDRHARAVR